jgi:hypothetical protein
VGEPISPKPENVEGPCCAHIHVDYRPIEFPGGVRAERWNCRDCGHEFIPVRYPRSWGLTKEYFDQVYGGKPKGKVQR